MPPIDRNLIDNHHQLYALSCIPSAVELVLKLLGRVPADYYDLQHAWKNYEGGSFSNFDGETIQGVTFKKQFSSFKRNNRFPLEALFYTIEQELEAGRYVIVSLEVMPNRYHMYIVYDAPLGEYTTVTKSWQETVYTVNVKLWITGMQGADILTYRKENNWGVEK